MIQGFWVWGSESRVLGPEVANNSCIGFVYAGGRASFYKYQYFGIRPTLVAPSFLGLLWFLRGGIMVYCPKRNYIGALEYGCLLKV